MFNFIKGRQQFKHAHPPPLSRFVDLCHAHGIINSHIALSESPFSLKLCFNRSVMPSLRTRTRNPRPATSSLDARPITRISSLSAAKSEASMLDMIAVAGPAAPASVFSSSLASHVIETNVRNQAAIAAALTRANHMLQSNRAENTKKAYILKKNLWSAWCQEREFDDGDTVTESKLCF